MTAAQRPAPPGGDWRRRTAVRGGRVSHALAAHGWLLFPAGRGGVRAGVVETVPDGPARDWLHDIGRRLDVELAEALRMARLGQTLEAGTPGGGDVARSVGARLEVARTAFFDTTEHAASIALDLRSDTGFEHLRAQLDQLAAQAPHLRQQT